jgi:hypothetical protein
MKRSLIPLSILCGALAASGTALADHNSKNGEGWANMPNDIHNMRIETKEADDNEAFKDFVKYGEGSTSENRFASDDTVPAQAKKQQGKADQVQNKGASQAQNQVATGARSQDRTRTETRSRIHRDSSMTSQRTRSASGNRGGGRKGGGKR